MGTDLAQQMTLRAWWLATELKRLRAAADLTIAEVCRRTGINRATLQRNEAGQAVPHPRNLADLLTLYGVKDAQRALLIELAAAHDVPGWWKAYKDDVLPQDYGTFVGFEAQAAKERDYSGPYIPGLLQVESYATEIIRGNLPGISDAEVDKRVTVRMQRQAGLAGDEPLQLHAIVFESALHVLAVGMSATARREQLHALLNLPDGLVTLQVIPFRAGPQPGLAGPFSLLKFRHPRAPQAVFSETGAGQVIIEDPVFIERYEGYWADILAKSLSPEESASLIGDMLTKRVK